MSEIEVEGKTVEEAIRTGLEKLGCARDKVEIKILNEGTSGLFGLMGNKPARVLLTTKEGTPAESIGEADLALAQTRAMQVTGEIIKLMQLSFTDIHTALMAGRVLIEVKSADSTQLIGKNGQTLDALENIIGLILSRDPKTRVKISLDTDDYRRKQDERLEDMAAKAAEQVMATGKTFRFEPMPARSRRVIHLALKNNPDVETFSEGEGMFRKVGVKPKK